MGAPIIIEIPKNVIDPLRIALVEFENGAIPMTGEEFSEKLLMKEKVLVTPGSGFGPSGKK